MWKMKLGSYGVGVLLALAVPVAAAASPAIVIRQFEFEDQRGMEGGGPVGEQQSGEFAVGNRGDAPLVITALRLTGPDAGLFSFESPCQTPGQNCAETFSIRPGAVMFFSVSCRPTQVGYFHASLEVTSNATRRAGPITFTCIGNGPPIIDVSPSSLDFGTAHSCHPSDSCSTQCATRPSTQTFTVTNTAPPPSALDFTLPVIVDGSSFTTTMSSCGPSFLPCRLLAGQSRTFELSFHPKSDWLTPDIQLVVQSHFPTGAPVEIPLHARGGAGSWHFESPTVLAIGPVGQPIITEITGRSSGVSCLSIERFTLDSSFFGGDYEVLTAMPPFVELASGESFTWTIRCTPHSVEGPPARATVEVTGEAVPFFNADFACQAPGGLFITQPQSVGLAAPVGSSSSQRVTLRNFGNQTTELTQITSDDPQFSAAPVSGSLPLSVAVGDVVEIDVTFAPTAPGQTGALMTFDAALGDDFILNVFGVANEVAATVSPTSRHVAVAEGAPASQGCRSTSDAPIPWLLAVGLLAWIARRRRRPDANPSLPRPVPVMDLTVWVTGADHDKRELDELDRRPRCRGARWL
jgi:MYXO-CTERM domain-containing protein